MLGYQKERLRDQNDRKFNGSLQSVLFASDGSVGDLVVRVAAGRPVWDGVGGGQVGAEAVA